MTNTVVENEIVAEIISTHYTIGKQTHCQLIRAAFNHNYLIETTNQTYVLRIYLNDKYYIHNAGDFRFELDLLNFLLNQALPVVQPVANQKGEWLTTYQFAAQDRRHMALFQFVPGVELDKVSSAGDLTLDTVKRVGEIMALIHQAAEGFQSQYHRYHLNVATYLLDKSLQILETHLINRKLGDLSFFRPCAEQLRQQVSLLPQTTPAYGLIHADLHGNNIFLDAKTGITFIDFDHCAYSYRIYEFAPWAGNAEALASVIEGYESVRPLSKLEKQLIPTVAKLRSIWDMGDILYYMPLWGRTPSDEQLENWMKQLHTLL